MDKLLLLSDFGLKVFGSLVVFLFIVTVIFYLIEKSKGPSPFVTELRQRTRSWWIIVVLCSLTFFVNHHLIFVALPILSFFAFKELIGPINFGQHKNKFIAIAIVVIPIQYFYAYINYFNGFITWIPLIATIGSTFLLVLSEDIDQISRKLGLVYWVLLTTVFSFSHLAYLYTFNWPESFIPADQILFLLLLTEGNDVLQFTAGKIFGKTKILPKVSPKKTVEGFLGGLVGSIVLGCLMAPLLQIEIYKLVILCALLALVGFCGDVTFSALKREAGIKDMSALIPGHGGILDRADSLVFTAIAFFHFLRLWG